MGIGCSLLIVAGLYFATAGLVWVLGSSRGP